MSRRINIVIALLLLIVEHASAFDFKANGILYSYMKNGKSVEVSAGCQYKGFVTIPDSVMYLNTKYVVAGIGYRAFMNCTEMKVISMPNTIKIIGADAFVNCQGLSSIFIPDSVTNIDSCAFRGCTGLKSVNLGRYVTEIGPKAFWDCANLESIDVVSGNSIYASVDGSLYDKHITALISVPTAKKGCFNIPTFTSYIGQMAFYGCSGIKAFKVDKKNHFFTSIDGVLYSLDKKSLVSVPHEIKGNFIIPCHVVTIEECAFADCKHLSSVIIPNSVKKIGVEAFYLCKELSNVSIGKSVKSIDMEAFRDCVGLKSIILPESVTGIGKLAFAGCTGLTSVNIPKAVTYIGENSFAGCSNLTAINVNDNNSVYTSIGGIVYDKYKTTVICTPLGK